MHAAGRILVMLLLFAAVACAPRLRNDPPPGDDDDVAGDDDDDAVGDPCCEASGGPDTITECDDGSAAECVCDVDDWCCGEGWDGDCAAIYVSPCGALTCGL